MPVIASTTIIAQRFARLCVAASMVALLALVNVSCVSSRPQAGHETSSSRDFTFFLFSDIHLGAENLKAKQPLTKADTLARVKSNLETMQKLPGRPYPANRELTGLKLGTVATPRALFLLGDVTDGHREPGPQREQWRTFETLFLANGVKFGGQAVPVFACAGNHDGALDGPQRQGLVKRNRQFAEGQQIAVLSSNGVHFALKWNGVHFISLNLCPADTTDAETPFKYGKPGPGSWNDPQGALSFLKEYLAAQVGASGEPVVLMHHYGFDSFSLNDWNWWTPKQRRALYEALQNYNVAAILHGHDHHTDHYRWPDPKRHARDIEFFFDGKAPANFRQYDVISCGSVCWVLRVRGDQLIAAHFKGPDWDTEPAGTFVKSLKP